MSLTFEYLDRPGRNFSDAALERLVSELRTVASACFDSVPSYQCLTGDRAELSRTVIAIARSKDGKMVGFCSSVFFTEGKTPFLHLGLTCILPEIRSKGLTHRLVTRVITQTLITKAPLRGLVISNVACVLSSLGNVALHFEDIYPSPFGKKVPKPYQLRVAQAISESHRKPLGINDDAKFDDQDFVFRKSVEGTVFKKETGASKCLHRMDLINEFYAKRIDFAQGDEVLQIGRVSFLSYPKYIYKRWSQT